MTTMKIKRARVPNNWLPNDDSACAIGKVSSGKTTLLTKFECETIVVAD
jgi:hypothetical protein